MVKKRTTHNRVISVALILCLVLSFLSGCGFGSQHLEVTYENNENEDIHNWEDVDNNGVTTWDNAAIVAWSDIDEYSDWVYSEILFEEIPEDMPIVECRVLSYQSNGKYFDGEKVYQMVGDKFDVNSFVAKYAVGTGVIVICVVLNIVTAGASTPVACFIAGAADASVSMAIKGAAFGGAMKAILRAIKSGGDIEVGDAVYAYDESTGTYADKPVTQISFGETSETVRVYVDEEVIECTPNHPFLTDCGWVQASELKEGSRVLSENNNYCIVTTLETVRHDSPVLTYTLCVDDYHSFLVGHCRLVVHNKCKPNEKYADDTYRFPEGSAQAAKYPNGVPFDSNGYPIFDQYATKTVKFDFPSLEGKTAGTCLTGNCTTDFRLANQAAGLSSTPAGYTWHHCQDMMTMQLVPQDVHSVVFGGVAHAGGESALAEFWATLMSTAVIP